MQAFESYIYFGSSNKVCQIYQKVIDFNVTLAIGAIILFNHQNRTDLTKDKVAAKSHPVYFALGCGLCVQEPQYLGVFKTQFMERFAVGSPPKPRGSSLHSFFIATIFHIGCFQESTWDWVGEDSLSMRSSSYIQFVIHWSNNTHNTYFSCRKSFNNRGNRLNLAILAKGIPVCLI